MSEDFFGTDSVFIASFWHYWFGILLICNVSDNLIRNDEWLCYLWVFILYCYVNDVNYCSTYYFNVC